MGTSDLLTHLSALGLQLTREGDGIRVTPRRALTDETRDLIREHKTGLLAMLAAEAGPSSDRGADARRQRALAMLAERPGIRYALVTDDTDHVYPNCVVIGVGIRQDDGAIYTADIITPAERFDGIRLLELIEQYGGTVQ